MRYGWGRRYRDELELLNTVKVWHFSGAWETAPWMFQDLPDANSVFESAKLMFFARDPGCIVATALYEWRKALDTMIQDDLRDSRLAPLRAAATALASCASQARSQAWNCDDCWQPRIRVHSVSLDQCAIGRRWLCADCIVARLMDDAENEGPRSGE